LSQKTTVFHALHAHSQYGDTVDLFKHYLRKYVHSAATFTPTMLNWS